MSTKFLFNFFNFSAISKLFVFQLDSSASERVLSLYKEEFFLLSQKEVGQKTTLNFQYKKIMILVIGSFACICLCISVGSSYISSNDMPLGPIIEHRRPIGRAIPDLFIYKSKSNGMFFASITSSFSNLNIRAAEEPGQGLAEPVQGPAQGLAEPGQGLAEPVQGPAQGLAEPVQGPAQGLAEPVQEVVEPVQGPAVQGHHGPRTPVQGPRGPLTCPGAPARVRHAQVARIDNPLGPLRGRWYRPPVQNRLPVQRRLFEPAQVEPVEVEPVIMENCKPIDISLIENYRKGGGPPDNGGGSCGIRC